MAAAASAEDDASFTSVVRRDLVAHPSDDVLGALALSAVELMAQGDDGASLAAAIEACDRGLVLLQNVAAWDALT